MSNQTSPGAVAAGKLPTAWIAGGVVALVSIAAAAAIALRPSAAPTPEAAAPAPLVAAKAAQADEAVAPKPVTAPQAVRPAKAPVANTSATKVSSVCGHCGVVESVVAVKRKGEATGLGVVAGGVLGAVVGHQMGNGNGKKAMTVLGAVGGGVAGNEVEKHARGDTVYQVRVRMDDNTERTIEQTEPPHVGARVDVQGNTLKALRTAG